jgi:hypothetical protein
MIAVAVEIIAKKRLVIMGEAAQCKLYSAYDS